MSTTVIPRVVLAAVLTAGAALAGTTTAAAEPYTRQFTGVGGSSFGFAWEYARWNAQAQAEADGFTDPRRQCVEIYAFGDIFWAEVVWECTREV